MLFSLLLVIAVSSFLYGEEKFGYTIASYTTSVGHQDNGVKRNISLACEKLNGTVINSKMIFSFNKTVGEGSAENGFQNGRVLYQDKTVYEAGGGLCQVSSTLYNALLLSGCTIIERRRHYQPVTYVPLGLDATIKYGKKDLRMKNPYPQALYIFTDVSDKTMTVMIKSDRPIPFSYEIFTEEEDIVLPFAEKSERDIRPGLSIHVYRKKLKKGILIENFLMYKDFYPPVYTR